MVRQGGQVEIRRGSPNEKEREVKTRRGHGKGRSEKKNDK